MQSVHAMLPDYNKNDKFPIPVCKKCCNADTIAINAHAALMTLVNGITCECCRNLVIHSLHNKDWWYVQSLILSFSFFGFIKLFFALWMFVCHICSAEVHFFTARSYAGTV